MNKKIIILNISYDNLKIKASLDINNSKEEIITNINQECIDYICIDRIDAYVIGFIYFAMKNGYDIESNIPISESLYYNLNEIFIDALRLGNPFLHRVKINAPIIQDINRKSGNVVATGISCGVDSLYTIATHSKSDIPDSYRINTLCFLNVGAAFKGKDDSNELVNGRLILARTFANEYGYKFLNIESNIHNIIHKYSDNGYSHIESHTYMALFCIFCIQYGISKYYYSSGCSLSEFNINNNKNLEFDSAQYDLLILNVASVNLMKIISTGSDVSRLYKIRLLCNYPPAFKYLNVCVNKVKNDNICFKCKRTLLEIDAVGDINKFHSVFDIDFYKMNKESYLSDLYKEAVFKKNHFYIEIYPHLKKNINTKIKIKTILTIIRNRIMR